MAWKYPPIQEKRSSDGISVCPALTQKEAEGGKKQC
jgi:hypothetical protein